MSVVTWKLELAVTDGPKLTLQDKMEIEAYGKLDLKVDPGGTQRVSLQPLAKEDTNFLLIQRTSPKPEPRPASSALQLTYTIDGVKDTVGLYDAHVLAGEGVMTLLLADPKTLFFKNLEDRPVNITILVGRRITATTAAATPAVTGP